MITNSAKQFGLLGIVALVLAFVYNTGDLVLTGSDDTPDEVYDGVYQSIFAWNPGDLVGWGILISVFLAGMVGFALALATRDAPVPAEEVVEVPVERGSVWPLMGALGLGVAAVGLVVDRWVAIAGFALLALAALEWISTAWADRYSVDPSANSEVRSRIMLPLELPLFAAVCVGAPVLLFSRVLLASSKTGAAVIATAVSVVLLTVFFILYVRPALMRSVAVGLGVFAAVVVLVSGLVAAAIGPREFEIHVGEHGEHGEEDHSDEEMEEGLGSPVEVLSNGGEEL